MEGELGFNRPLLLVIAAVPRQLLLVEADHHLRVADAGFAGRQQGHVLGVLPEAEKRDGKEGMTMGIRSKICAKLKTESHFLTRS